MINAICVDIPTDEPTTPTNPMSDNNKNEVVALLRNFAQKLASGGSPDRLTAADGQGGISTNSGGFKHDSALDALTRGLPADANPNAATGGQSSAPDRLTVADGQGGISTSHGSVKADPALAALTRGLPADLQPNKSASDRVSAIRNALGMAVAPVSQQKSAAPSRVAAAPSIDMSQDMLAKIASAALSTEDGINFIHNLFEKQAGEAAARQQIAEAISVAEHYDVSQRTKSAAINDVLEKSAAIYRELSGIITEREADEILKTAADHQAELLSLGHDLLKQAHALGMDDASKMEGASEAEEQGAAPQGATEGAIPMGGEQLSEEEILHILHEMIASGEISEQDVMEAIHATGGGGEGAPAPEGAPAQ